ncbi:MAG: hypothetical protein R3C28_10805 [Pirellulaceae bacterium]
MSKPKGTSSEALAPESKSFSLSAANLATNACVRIHLVRHVVRLTFEISALDRIR